MDPQKKGKKDFYDYQSVVNPENTTQDDLINKWLEIKDAYKIKYPQLDASNFEYLPGQFTTMLDVIASKTKRCKSEVSNEIRHWDL